MVFTVGIPGGTRDDEYEAYIRLLEKSGVNVAETSRVAEPATGKRWLNAWASRDEADRFAARLREETGNQGWKVYELPDDAASTGPLGPVVILIGRQSDGLSYTLSPSSKKLIWKKFPRSSIAPSVFISTMTQADIEAIQGPIWDQVAIILTGLSTGQIDQLGGYQIYDPISHSILREAASLKV